MRTLTRVEELLRPEIREFRPYANARAQNPLREAVYLDANENAAGNGRPGIFRYPDPQQSELRQSVAALRGVEARQVFIGNGSDEGIDLLMRAFCRPQQDEVLVQPPTYGMYETFARLNGVEVVEVELTSGFEMDTQHVLQTLRPTTKLTFICSPNNPTGNCQDRQAIREVLQRSPGLVVIDEAYIDFCAEESWLPELAQHDNLIILQTLSKGWSAAGIRIGMLFAHPEIITVLDAIKPPYNVSSVSQSIAVDILSNESHMRRAVHQVLDQRRQLSAALADCPEVVTVFPSAANFLLVRFRNAAAMFQHLRREGIVVRDRSTLPGCVGCLRITVGTSSENRQLLSAIRHMRGQ